MYYILFVILILSCIRGGNGQVFKALQGAVPEDNKEQTKQTGETVQATD